MATEKSTRVLKHWSVFGEKYFKVGHHG
uniref:Uncharacterized protein n=1 Tax=Rhizophora mucronata TaxID=61149 RepID=A0A2P2QNT1_RHIMU